MAERRWWSGVIAAVLLAGASPALAGTPEEDVTAAYDKALDLLTAQDDAGAEAAFAKVEEQARAALGEDAYLTLGARANRALAIDYQGRHEEAIALMRPLLAKARSKLGEADPLTLTVLEGLASALTDQHDEQAVGLYAEAVALRRKAGADSAPLAQALTDQARAFLAFDRFADAEAPAREALAIDTRVLGAENGETLRTVLNLAQSLSGQGKQAESVALVLPNLDIATRTLGRLADTRLLMLTLAMNDQFSLGRLDEAEKVAAERVAAYRLAGAPGSSDQVSALRDHAIILAQLKRWDAAEAAIREARRVADAAFSGTDRISIMVDNTLADILSDTNRYQEAETFDRRALENARKALTADDPLLRTILPSLAIIDSHIGKPLEAERLSAEALRAEIAAGGERSADALIALGNYATVLASIGRRDEAVTVSRRAWQLSAETLGPDHTDTLVRMSNYGVELAELGRTAEAQPVLEQVLERRTRLLGEDNPDTQVSRRILAYNLQVAGHPDEALPLHEAVLAWNRRVLGDRDLQTIGALLAVGDTEQDLGRRGDADGKFAEALSLARQVTGPASDLTLDAAYRLANLRLGDPATAAGAYEPARAILENLTATEHAGAVASTDDPLQRGRDMGNARRFALFADAAWAAPGAVGDAVRKGEVFAALQDSLTNTTSRAVARNAALRAAARVGLGAEAQRREVLLARRDAITGALIAALGKSDPESIARQGELGGQRDGVERELAQLDDTIRAKAPDYFALLEPRPVDLAAAQALLAPQEAALMLIPTARGTHAMVVTREGLAWNRSALTEKDVAALTRRLLWDVGGDVKVSAAEAAQWGEQGEGATPYDFADAYKLYAELIAPLMPALEGKTQLFVSSAGALSALPLGILVSEVPAGADGDPATLRSAKWLADRFAISVIPSLQSLQFIRQFRAGKAEAPSAPYLGFGDPVLGGRAVVRGGRGRTSGDFARVFGAATRSADVALASPAEIRKLARLPGTRDEIDRQWRAFGAPPGGKMLEGAATESAVKHARLDPAVLSFATHGLLAGEIAGAAEPGLVLTPPDKPSGDDDGFLSASEIAALDIRADWVLLSACNTAAGDGSAGAPGLSGLARSFFFAGATNLLVSHWPVRDDVAARLTVRSIEIARDDPDITRSQALQRAMREIRNDASHDSDRDSWAHPSAWAPFSLVGDGARQ